MQAKLAATAEEWKSLNNDGGRQLTHLEDEFRVVVQFANGMIVVTGGVVNCELAKEAIDRSLAVHRKEQQAQDWKALSIYEGWLYKQGGSVRSWRKRYFRLEEGRLLYYMNEEASMKPFGVIPLPGSKLLIENQHEIGRKHVFRIVPSFKTSKKTFLLSAPSDKELKLWMSLLKDQTEVGFIHKGAIKEGYLVKCGNRHKNWKTRYFVLMGTQLAYYKEKTDTEPVGLVDLTLPSTLSLPESHIYKREFVIELKPGYGKRSYLLQAADKADCEAWLAKFKEICSKARAPTASMDIGVLRPMYDDGGYRLQFGKEISRVNKELAPDGLPIPEVI